MTASTSDSGSAKILYDIEELPEEYKNLLKSICVCVSTNAFENLPHNNSVWDGSVFLGFVSHMTSTEKNIYKNLLRKKIIEYADLRRLNKPGISPARAKNAFCLSAEAQRIPLQTYIEKYVNYCIKINYTPKAFENHKSTIEKILKKTGEVFSPESGSESSSINFQDQVLLGEKIKEIKEKASLYPYIKQDSSPTSSSVYLQALHETRSLIQVHSNHFELIAIEAKLLVYLDREDEALDVVEEAYAKNDAHLDILIAYAATLRKLKRTEEALHIAQKAQQDVAGSDSPVLLLMVGTYLAELEKYEEAIPEIKRAITLDENFLPAYRGLAWVYRKLGQYKQSELILRKGLSIAPDNYKIAADLVETLQKMGEDAKAEKLLFSFDQNKIPKDSLFFVEALKAFNQNNFDKAIAIITENIDEQDCDPFITDKEKANSLRMLANFFEVEYGKSKNRKCFSLAKNYYIKSLDLIPDNGDALFRGAAFCFFDGEYEQGHKYLNKICDTDIYKKLGFKITCDVYLEMCEALYALGIQDFDQPLMWGIEKNPDGLICMTGLIKMGIHKQNLSEACSYADKSLSLADKITKGKLTIRLVGMLGDFSETLLALEKALPKPKGYWKHSLRFIRICCAEEVRGFNRDFWERAHSIKADILCEQGFGGDNIDFLIEAKDSCIKLLDSILRHRDHEKWIFFNNKLYGINRKLWQSTDDANYLKEGIKYLRNLIEEVDADGQRNEWLDMNIDLATDCMDVGRFLKEEKYIDMAEATFGKIIESLSSHEKSSWVSILDKGDDFEIWVECNYYLGFIKSLFNENEFFEKRYQEAISHFLEVIKHSKGEYLGKSWDNLAYIYHQLGLHKNDAVLIKKSIDYYEKSLGFLDVNSWHWANAHAELGRAYQYVGITESIFSDLEKSVHYFNSAIRFLKVWKTEIQIILVLQPYTTKPML